jgi:hypothetical protein
MGFSVLAILLEWHAYVKGRQMERKGKLMRVAPLLQMGWRVRVLRKWRDYTVFMQQARLKATDPFISSDQK